MILVILNFSEWYIDWFELSTSFFSIFLRTNKEDRYFVIGIRFGNRLFKKRWGDEK